MADTVEQTIYELILQDNASAPLKKFLELFGSRPKQIEALGIALVKIQGAMDATGKTAATLSDILPHLTQNFQEIATQVGAPVVSARALAAALRAVERASADVTGATKGTAQSVAEVGQQAAGAAKSLETAATASKQFVGNAIFGGVASSAKQFAGSAQQAAQGAGQAAQATKQLAGSVAPLGTSFVRAATGAQTLGQNLGAVAIQSQKVAGASPFNPLIGGAAQAAQATSALSQKIQQATGAAASMAPQVEAVASAQKNAGDTALGMAAGIAFATFSINRATRALGEFTSNAVEQFAALQKGMATVNAIADFSADRLNRVTKAVQDLSTEVPQTTQELSKALFDTISAIGVVGDDATRVLAQSAKAAVAGNTDALTAGKAALTILNAFGLSISKFGDVEDAIFQGAVKARGTFEEFSKAFIKSTASAVSSNQSYQETAAVLEILTRKGILVAQSGTSASRAFADLAKHRVDFKKLAGVDVIDATTGKIRGLIEVLTDFSNKTKDLSELQRNDILRKLFPSQQGFRAASSIVGDTKQSNALLSDQTAQIIKVSDGYTRAVANIVDQSKLLQNTVDAAFGDIGKASEPVLLSLIGNAKGVVQSFRDTPQGFKAFVGIGAEVAKVAGTITVALLGLGGALRGFKFLFADAATGALGFSSALRGLGLATIGPAIGAFLITPLGLVTAALVAGGVAWLAYKTHVNAAAREQAAATKAFVESSDNAQPLIATLIDLGKVQNRTADQNRLLEDTFKKLKSQFPEYVAGINSSSDALAHQNQILDNNISRLNVKAQLEQQERAKSGQQAGLELGDLRRREQELNAKIANLERQAALRVAGKTTELGVTVAGRTVTGPEAERLRAQNPGFGSQIPLPPLPQIDVEAAAARHERERIRILLGDKGTQNLTGGILAPDFLKRGTQQIARFQTVGGSIDIDAKFAKVVEQFGALMRAEHGGRDIAIAVGSTLDRIRFGAPGSREGGPVVPFGKGLEATVLDLAKRAGFTRTTAKDGQIVAELQPIPEPKVPPRVIPGVESRVITDDLQKRIDETTRLIELTKAQGDARAAAIKAAAQAPDNSLKEIAAGELRVELEKNNTAHTLVRLEGEKAVLEAQEKQVKAKRQLADQLERAKKAQEKDPSLAEDPEAKRILSHAASEKDLAATIKSVRATTQQNILKLDSERLGFINEARRKEIDLDAEVGRKLVQRTLETAALLDKIEIDRLKATGQKAAALQLEAQSEGRKRLLEIAQAGVLNPAQLGGTLGKVTETLSADFLKNQIAVHQEERNAAQRLAAETRQEFENNARDVIEFGEFTRAEQLGIITVAIAGLRQQGLVSRQLLREQKQLLRDGVGESRRAADEVSRHILDLAEQNTRVAGLGERGIIAVREAIAKDSRLTDEDSFANSKALEEARKKFVQDNEKEILDTRRKGAEDALKSAEEQQKAFLDSVAQQRESLKAPIVSFLTGPASAKSLIQAFAGIGDQVHKVLAEKLTDKLLGKTLNKSAEGLALAAGTKQISAAEVQLRAAEVQALAADKQLGLKEIQDVRLAPQAAAATLNLQAVTGRSAQNTITTSGFSPPDKGETARVEAGRQQEGLNRNLFELLRSIPLFGGAAAQLVRPSGGAPQLGGEERFQDRINALRGTINPEVIAQANADLAIFSQNLKAAVAEVTALAPLLRRAVEREQPTGPTAPLLQKFQGTQIPDSLVQQQSPIAAKALSEQGKQFVVLSCAKFVSEVLRSSVDGLQNERTKSVAVLTQDLIKFGAKKITDISQAIEGDIAVFKPGTLKGSPGHTGVVVKERGQLGLEHVSSAAGNKVAFDPNVLKQADFLLRIPQQPVVAPPPQARVQPAPRPVPPVGATAGGLPVLPTATVPQEIGVAFTLDAHAKEKFNAAVAPLQDFRATVQGSVGLLLSVLPALAPGFEVEIDRLLAPLREPIHIRREVFPEFVLPEVKPLSVPQPVEIAFSIIGDTAAAILAAIRPLQSLHPHQEAQVDLGLSVVPQLLAGFQERVAGLLAPLQAPLTLFRDVDQILRVSQKQELSGANGLPALDAPGRVAEALSVRQPVDVTFDLDPRVGEKFAAALVPVRSLAPNLTEVVDVLLDIQPRLEERFAEEISRTLLPLTVAEHLVKNVDQRVVVAVSEEINFPDQQRERERILAGLTSPTPLTVTQAVGLDFTLEPNFDQEFQRAIAPAADLHAALTGLASIEVQTAPFLAGDAGRKLEAVLAPLQSPLRVIKDVVQELRVAVVESGSFQAQREQFLAAINAPVPPIITAIANMLSVTVAGDPSFASKMQAETAPLQAPLDLSRLVGMRLIVNPEPDAALPERLASLLRELAKPLEQVVTPVTNLLEVTPLMRTATGQDVSSLLDGLKVPLTVNRDVQVRPNVREALTAGETRFKPIPEFGPKPEIPAAATTPFVVPKGGFAKIDFPPDLERAVGRQFPAEEISNIISQFAAINKARPLTPIGGAGGPEGALRGQFGLDKRGLGTFDERVGGFLFPKTAPDGSNVVTFADNKINENLFGKVVGSPALAAILDKARAKDERAKATKDTQPEPHFTNLAKFGQLLNSFQSGQGSQGILGQGLSAITSFGAGSQISPAFGWLSAGLSLLGGLFGKKKKTPQPQDPFPALPSVDATNFASIRRIQGSGEAGREGGPIPLAGKQQITLTTTAQVSFAEIHIHSGDARSAGREFLGGISEAGARSLAGQLAGSKV